MTRRPVLMIYLVLIFYLAFTVYAISKADSLTLSYLTMDSWLDHYRKHSLPISPINSWVAWHVVHNRSEDRFSDLDERLGGIDGILGLNWQRGRRDTEKVMSLARLFLENGANVDFVDKYTGCSAVHEAIGRRDKLSVDFLKKNGADLEYYSIEDRSLNLCRLTPKEILKRIDSNEQFWETHGNPGSSTLSIKAIIREPAETRSIY